MMTDPIADMLTRIRNAQLMRHPQVEVPASQLKLQIAKILQAEGYIKSYRLIEDGRQGILRLRLKYGSDRARAISNLQRVSRPGRRIYVDRKNIPRVRAGLGIAILSTSRGVLTDEEARRLKVGGEILCYVW